MDKKTKLSGIKLTKKRTITLIKQTVKPAHEKYLQTKRYVFL